MMESRSRWCNWLLRNAAGRDVDLNGKAIKNLAQVWVSPSTELTLASDTVTPTQIAHSVDTQADAAADDLVTLTADAAKINRLCILRCENAGRVVTIRTTGNIVSKYGDLVLNDLGRYVILMQHSATAWTVLAAGWDVLNPLAADLDANTKSISNIGRLGLKILTQLVISSGAITITQSQHSVDSEGQTGDDDLDTSTSSPTITSESIASGDMIIGCMGSEGNDSVTYDSDTTNGSWSTGLGAGIGSGTGASQCHSQRKIVTASGTQTYDLGYPGSRDNCEAWISITRAAGGHAGILANGVPLRSKVGGALAA